MAPRSNNTLTFLNADLRVLVSIAVKQWPKELRPLFGVEKTKRGFWLIGDQGVYLMHNGQTTPRVEKQPLVYAVECNPDEMDFDAWWEAKRRTFGGDDGVEFIDAKTVETIEANGEDMVIAFTKDQFEVYGEKPTLRDCYLADDSGRVGKVTRVEPDGVLIEWADGGCSRVTVIEAKLKPSTEREFAKAAAAAAIFTTPAEKQKGE